MKPYYQDELVTLYHGDCLEQKLWLDADVLIWDPPYGIDYNSGSRRDNLAASILNDEDTRVRDEVLALWYETGQRPSLTFGSSRIEKPAGTKQTLIWDKGSALGMGDLRIPWKPSHEEIYVLGNWAGARGERGSDVIKCNPMQATARLGRLHPHQKPLPLMQELVSKAPLGTIADPTAGVGSTLVAAASFGQRAIGYEMDESYCEIAANRLSTRIPAFADVGF